jgi:PTH1 family peptidyl-tRNA hydrolase
MPGITACARSPRIWARIIAESDWASAIHSYVLNDFAKAEQAWVSALCDGIARNCAMLTKRDDAGFQNKLHLFMEAAGFGDVKKIGDERKA